MSEPKQRSLKAQNWLNLVLYVILNVLVFTIVVSGQTPDLNKVSGMWATLTTEGGLAVTTLSFATIILTSILPNGWKEALIFWRLKNPLPGCRVFSKLAKRDQRIDLNKIKSENGGTLPRGADGQNKLWYRIYKNHADKPPVEDAHRTYLMTRDLSGISFLLSIILGSASMIMSPVQISLPYFAVLVGVFLCWSVTARNNGNRFVLNVLAEESTEGRS